MFYGLKKWVWRWRSKEKAFTIHLCFSDFVGGLMSDALPAAFLMGFRFMLLKKNGLD
jgi:hypothetical protein